MDEKRTDPKAKPQEKKQAWQKPAIVDLPPLVDLTLQTGGGIPGGGGPGSTVIP